MSTLLRQRANGLPRQNGVVLLAFLLIFIVGTTFTLIAGLNRQSAQANQQQQTALALAEAKATLIGYAATYPDNINPASGPGYLPCPDVTNDGEPRTACALATDTHVGRLPWNYLGIGNLRDGSGERLWYAVADNFRYSPQLVPLNSDTLGQLTVDTTMTDIVAVIIAPGTPVGAQAGRAAAPNDRTNYLEDDNADADVGFVTQAAGVFNDRVAIITRAELMVAVERRVLGEAANALNNYRQDPDRDAVPGPLAFPWLSPFADPTDSPFDQFIGPFDGVVGTFEGHLPVHTAGQNILAPFQVSWALTSITNDDPTGVAPPILPCVSNSGCIDPVAGPLLSPIIANTLNGDNCVWVAKDVINCTVSQPLNAPNWRQYVFTFNNPAVAATLSPPAVGGLRMRHFNLSGTNTIGQIDVSDWSPGPVELGRRVITTDAGTFDLLNIPYDLDPNAGQNEIAQWFIANNWHHHIYIGYEARPLPLTVPGDLTVCAVGVDCLTVCSSGVNCPADAAPAIITNARAVAITAGIELPAQLGNRPSAILGDYFDLENALTADRIFHNQSSGPLFNDQVRVVLP